METDNEQRLRERRKHIDSDKERAQRFIETARSKAASEIRQIVNGLTFELVTLSKLSLPPNVPFYIEEPATQSDMEGFWSVLEYDTESGVMSRVFYEGTPHLVPDVNTGGYAISAKSEEIVPPVFVSSSPVGVDEWLNHGASLTDQLALIAHHVLNNKSAGVNGKPN